MKQMKLNILGLLIGGAFLWGTTSCKDLLKDPYLDETFIVYDLMPISSYLETEPELFSEWVQILHQTDLYNALNLASLSYTLFAPTNEAVREFYADKRVNSAVELDSLLGHEYLRQLVLYHILQDSVPVDKFIQGGQLTPPTYTGDFLEVRFGNGQANTEQTGYDALYINGEAHVGGMDAISVSTVNGVIYVLDDVLRPMIDPMVNQLYELGRNDIMCGALDATGWSEVLADHLKTVNSGSEEIELINYYTLLAVPDEVFNENGIDSWQELAAYVGADGDYRNPQNSLYQYVSYHILEGYRPLESLRCFDVPLGDSTQMVHARLWDTRADMPIKVTMTPDSVLTMNAETGMGAWIEAETADYRVRNGLIHQLTGMLPIPATLQPERVCYDVADCGWVRSYIERHSTNGQVFQSSVKDVSNALPAGLGYEYAYGPQGPATKASALYYTAGVKSGAYRTLNHDCLYLNMGYMGEVTFETPVILPGRYRIVMSYLYESNMASFRTYKNGSNGGLTSVQLDGEGERSKKLLYSSISESELNNFLFELEVAPEVEFTETGRHTLNVRIEDPAASNSNKFYIIIDHFRFIPLED